jgi:O-methyltransferase involved in polyketide biosynthesis
MRLPSLTTRIKRLPSEECPNPLKRIALDFAQESLDDKLREFSTDQPVTAVIEGVFVYLTPEAIKETLSSLQRLFPQHQLLCDLMNKRFFDKFAYKMHTKLVEVGGTFTERPDQPAQMFLANGYAQVESVSMWQEAYELGSLKRLAGIPTLVGWAMLNVFVRDLNSYAVHRFHLDQA